MRRLKDLKPGMFIYTILVRYDVNFKHIIVSKRKILTILRTYYYNSFEIITEPMENENFTSTLIFGYECEDKRHCYKGPFIYCFSEDALMRELKFVIKAAKQNMSEKRLFSAIGFFYNSFMPRTIKLIYINKSGCIGIKIKDI